jgi:23S rRNA (guanosine2251-2'-O)-methyltransferase
MRKLRNSELNRLSVAEFKKAKKLPFTIVLDDVRSHHNVGSIFRTCDALRVERLVLGGITPVPPHPDIEKTALGATASVTWHYVDDVTSYINHHLNAGKGIIALEHTNTSKSILDFQLPATTESLVLVFGNEVKGVQQRVLERCDHILEIPQIGTKHSLNVSVSAGMAIWEFAKPHLMQ